MSRAIVKIKDRYLEWSTVADAPTTYGMNLQDFKEYYRSRWGEEIYAKLDARLDRVERKGTSVYCDDSVLKTVLCNRAGYRERNLTLDELYEWFCVKQESPPEHVGMPLKDRFPEEA